MNFSFLPEAEDRHTDYYEDLEPGLGLDFLNEVNSAISRAMENPQAWTEIETGIRRCLTQRFPCGVLYNYLGDQQEILIIAVMHNHREPRYWKSRRKK